MEVGVIFATLLLMVVLFLIVRLIIGPLKNLTRFFINCGISLIIIITANFVGAYLGYHVPVNPVSVMTIGLLGAPGFVMVTLLSFLFI